MSLGELEAILKQVDQLLAQAGDLPEDAALAVSKLLNVVEALTADNTALVAEVERLRKLVEQKKKGKTTADPQNSSDDQPSNSDHSSEKRRRKREQPTREPTADRRSFKALTIHETIECRVDPQTLPAGAVRIADEEVVVRDIEIKPNTTRFQRHVYYSAAAAKYYRGPLPAGYERGDFSANLRALILALKSCGKMSEPKIGEFLANFAVQVSAGSLSNILTNTAEVFEQEYQDVLTAGLLSTSYQPTDDTSARVRGQWWHTHIVCNPFYTVSSTRPSKDRLAVLSVRQNTDQLRFRWNAETLQWLREEFAIPVQWQASLAALGEDAEFDAGAWKTLLDGWFGARNRQTRTAIERAAAIVYYRRQSSVQVVQTLVGEQRGAVQVADRQAGSVLDSRRASRRASFAHRGSAREGRGLNLWSAPGTTMPCGKIIAPARRRSWRTMYVGSSTSGFQLERDTPPWMSESRRRRPTKTRC